MKSKVFGIFDRALGGVAVSLIVLVAYGKILSDFAQFYITGHTTHFLWFLGDIFVNQSQPNILGSYSMMGFIALAVVGYCNMIIWMRLLNATGKPIYRFLSKYEIRRKDNILVVRHKKGRVTK